MLNFRKISISFFVLIFIISFISTPLSLRAAFGDYAGTSFSVANNGITPINLTFGGGFFWVMSGGGVINKYDTDWQYISTFTVGGGSIDTFGLTYYNDSLWVVGWSNGFDSENGYGVFEFTNTGVYTETHFMTNVAHAPFDIVEEGGFFWMVGGNFNDDQYLYKYQLNGTDTTEEVLITSAFNAYGIDFYDGHFWIAGGTGTTDYSVYKYDTAGVYANESFEATDFPNFDCGNGCNTGVIYNNGYFWLTDSTDDEVDAYSAVSDATAPTIQTLSPVDEANNVAIDTNLVITFDEAVDVETGNITIKKLSNDNTVETIDVTSGLVTGTGTTTIIINPSLNLIQGTEYYIQIDATAFDDAAGNSYAGIADSTTWNFTTEGSSSSSGSRSRSIKSSPIVKESPSTDTDGCTALYAYSPKTGAKCPEVSTPIPVVPSCNLTLTLKQGSTGEEVKCLQNKLQIMSDGIFGPKTKESVMNFQKLKNLISDGIVGPITRGVLNGD